MPYAGTGPLLNDNFSFMMTNGISASGGLHSNPSDEEISTIFVVGFPEDMQEREFQNMFIFSPGFEAATLKIPKDQEDDSNNSNNNNSGPNSARKQIIGFAKFRTRFEALEARDTLSGRKVDAEKGSVLKAEMAKKNLHTKRGLASNEQQQHAILPPQQQAFQLPPPPPSAVVANIAPTTANKRYPLNGVSHASAYEAFHSVPPALPSDRNPPNPDFYPDMMPPAMDAIFPSTASRASSFDTAITGRPPAPPPVSSAGVGGPSGAAAAVPSVRTNRLGSVDHHYHHPDERFNMLTFPPLQSVPEENMDHHHHHHHHHHRHSLSQTVPSATGATATPFSGLTISTTPRTTITSNGGLPSPGITSPTSFRSLGGSLALASVDHNPPCNTLYVGNLPNNANEEELRAMFAKSVGYLRLSFRNKSNGPMCFVEFENVACASQAMQELYGAMLSNSVKGGIRLSFSKNPLGVRADGRRESIQQAFEQVSLS
ncbi:hypothetical protein BX666DRAFT_2022078 [Dichotomocladium elegans]|nr:hypothetical protein BX666DRAFT_2022078 [Dichotomocladium elegans]